MHDHFSQKFNLDQNKYQSIVVCNPQNVSVLDHGVWWYLCCKFRKAKISSDSSDSVIYRSLNSLR